MLSTSNYNRKGDENGVA